MKFFALLAAALLTATAAMAEDHATFDVGAFTFHRPTTWEWVNVSSPMRKAQLKAPGTGSASAEVTFFFFGEQSGDVQSNAQRWLKQFEGAADAEKVEAQDVGKTKVTFVSTNGTYHSGMPGGPTTPLTDYALEGAILENPSGSVFVKMTGPKAVVDQDRAAFIEFIKAAATSLK